MAAALRFYASDGASLITSLYLGSVASPGTSSPQQIVLENFGDEAGSNLLVHIEAVPNGDGEQWALLAPDNGGTPGTFVVGPLALIDLQPNARTKFWTQTTIPASQPAESRPRRYHLTITGTQTDAHAVETVMARARIA